ncbi:hypothetical protein, partial [Thermus scotoductus]|uniref:hypothetical protein n=1 Tax=Thermus scotoductus TaxID=37636 RepID=UPI0015627440
GLPFPSLLPSRSSGGYPDPWGTSSPVGTPIHTHTLTHNSLHDPWLASSTQYQIRVHLWWTWGSPCIPGLKTGGL